MNIEKLKENFKVYCLNSHGQLVDNDLATDYEINHNGIFIELISIEEGSCENCDEYDFYIVDNDFYNDLTEYIIITPTEKINLPVGDDSKLEYFHFGVKIKKDEIIYGFNDFDEFIEMDECDLLFSDNENLHNYLTDKMKRIMKSYE